MKLWGRASSVNVQKVMWALDELAVPYERIDAGGRYGRTDTDEFARLNPNRRVPVLQDGEFALWESHAILRYLAHKHPEPDLGGGPAADQWMEFTSTSLQPPFVGLFWQVVRTPASDRSETDIARHLEALATALAILDARLTQVPFLAGDAFSVADIAAGSLMFRTFDMPVDRPRLPALRDWVDRLESRPGYRRNLMTDYDELRA